MKTRRIAKDTERDGGTRYPGASVTAFAGMLAHRISRYANRFLARYATLKRPQYPSHPLEFPPIRRAPYLGMQAGFPETPRRRAIHSRTLPGVLLLGTAMSMLAYAPLPAKATDETDKVVNIWLGNGEPGINNLTNLTWNIVVRNNSDINYQFPGNCIQVRLFDLYSSSEPTFGTLPSRWVGSANVSGNNLYNIILTPNRDIAEIFPGEKKSFPIRTYLASTNHIPVLGTRTGDGNIPPHGYFSDTFIGPVGSIEKIIAGNGSITNTPFFYEGSNTTFYIEADQHYRISDIKINNTSIGSIPHNLSQTNYVWQVPASGLIEAEFVLKDYTLTVVSEYPDWDMTNVGAPDPGTLAYQALSTATQSVDRIVVDPANPGRRLRHKAVTVE